MVSLFVCLKNIRENNFQNFTEIVEKSNLLNPLWLVTGYESFITAQKRNSSLQLKNLESGTKKEACMLKSEVKLIHDCLLFLFECKYAYLWLIHFPTTVNVAFCLQLCKLYGSVFIKKAWRTNILKSTSSLNHDSAPSHVTPNQEDSTGTAFTCPYLTCSYSEAKYISVTWSHFWAFDHMQKNMSTLFKGPSKIIICTASVIA